MPQLSLSLLGAPRIRLDRAEVTLERNKSLALLAYLAVAGEAQRRETLATLFWPDLDQAHARGGLRRVLWGLTSELRGPWWEVERETIRLLPGPEVALDLARFRQLLAVVRAHPHAAIPACDECCAALAEAASLYRGDFLAGFSLRGCPAFDEWQLTEAENLRRTLAAVLEQLSDAYAAQGQLETAGAYAQRWLALDPLHEPAQQQVMRLLAWSGQRSAALRQYEACARLLETELGIVPNESTIQLFRAVRDGTLAAPERLTPEATASSFSSPAAPLTVKPLPEARAAIEDGQKRVPLDRMVRGHLIGREVELARASAAWQRSLAGDGQVLLVSGEPGIGKTRLVRELDQAARGAGAQVLIGECSRHGELPYSPFVHIAHEVTGGPGRYPPLPDTVRADLLGLEPRRAKGLGGLRGQPDPNLERRRLFDGFTALCLALTQAAPLVLVIEDAHWADAGTLALLHHIARQTMHTQTLLVITYRDAEAALSEAEGLPELLSALARERQAQTIRLERLNRQQSGRMLAALLSAAEVSEAFRDGLFEETEGNPFFMEEVCKTLIEAGQLYYSGGAWHRQDMRTVVLPPSVRATILARVQRLPPSAQSALHLAAVLGRDFDFELLLAGVRRDEAALLADLDLAVRAQLIAEAASASQSGRSRYRFAHALIPFTLREALSGLRLQRLHGRAAQALERIRPGDVEGLAAHYTAAGEREKALGYTTQAATRAQAVYDDGTALHHLQAALGLADAPQTRLALIEQAGDVHLRRESNVEAAAAYHAALELEPGLPVDTGRRVRLLRKLAEAVWVTENNSPMAPFEPAANAALEEGLGLMAGQPSQADTVWLLIARAHSAWQGRVQQDWAAAERDSRQAVALAEQLDSPLDLSAALESLATVYAARNLYRERADASLRRVALTDEPRFAATRERGRALKEAGSALIDVGEYGQALHYLEQSAVLAARMHASEDLIYGLGEQARCLFHLDRWDDVLMDGKLRPLPDQPAAERLQPSCFHQALMASVHTLRGEQEAAAVLRDESVAVMVRSDPLDTWVRGHYY